MASYSQVLKSKAQGRRQRWYICGNEPAFVQDAYELALDHVYSVNVGVTKTVLLGPDTTFAEIANELTRDYYDERMVVVLHEAEKFTEWEALSAFLPKVDQTRFFIAVANGNPPDTKTGWGSVFTGSQKARFVVCNAMAPVELSEWVQSRLRITKDAESELIRRAWGDYTWLLNQVRKLEYIDTEVIETHLVKVLCPSPGTPDFVENLGKGNLSKRAAITSLTRGGVDERTYHALVKHLTNLVVMNVAKNTVGLSPRMIATQTGFNPKQISVYGKAAVYYDSQVTSRCFTALTRLCEGLQRGNRTSYLALITRW